MKHQTKAPRLVLAVEILLTILICSAVAATSAAGVEREANQFAFDVESDYRGLIGRYEAVFQALTMQVVEKVKEEPDFETMDAWLKAHDASFGEIVGKGIFDGYAMTYRGKYAHSWDYGNYDDYDPNTRLWYQEAARANGDIAVVAPYVTFLDESYLNPDQFIILTIAQRYSDEISFGLDLKTSEISALLINRSFNYPKAEVLLIDPEGYVLSTNNAGLYCHNVNEADGVVTEDLRDTARSVSETKPALKRMDGSLRYVFSRTDGFGNRLLLTVPFWEIFLRSGLAVCLIAALLILIEILVYRHNRARMEEIYERDRRISEITNAAFRTQLYVDLSDLACRRRTEGRETAARSYGEIYASARDRVQGEEAQKAFQDFLSPEALRKTDVNILSTERFRIAVKGEDGASDIRTMEYSVLVSGLEEHRTATIFENDVTEAEEQRRRVLQSIAYYYAAAFVGNAATRRYEVIKTNAYFERLFEGVRTIGEERMRSAAQDLTEESGQDFLSLAGFESVGETFKNADAATVNVQTAEGHWFSVRAIKSIGYEENHEFILCFENADEQMKSQQALRDALARETVATRAKTDFLSRMSHDIRTPLNGILGMTDIALEENKDDKVSECLTVIQSSGQFLLGLINDILDISKIESGQLELHERPVPLIEFDQIIDAVIRPLMAEKHIRFLYRMGCGMTCAKIDPIRFNQVFFNLLSNAAKYTPEGGEVRFTAEQISAEETLEWVRFVVSDSGVGMPPEFLKRAFEPFEQDRRSNEAQQRQGTGLGLAIARELVERMGGRIQLESEVNVGTTFTVDLPLKKAECPEPAVRREYPKKESLAGKRVLLVEDNRINTIVATKFLKSADMEVVPAANGQEGLDAFAASNPGHFDCVLMDMTMPVMDGLAATRAIRALGRPDAATVPIIAMTANAFDEDVLRCREAGMNAHLSKPISAQRVYETLSKFLSD